MSEENEDDSRHVDFTLASNWEIFIENLEKVIFEWKLPQVKRGPPLKKGELSNAAWDKTRKEKISFSDVDFTVTRYHLKLTPVVDIASPIEEDSADDGRIQTLDDIMCFENDFPPQKVWDLRDNLTPHPHPLAAWYGLRDFLILAPVPGNDITSETRIKLLLSSVYIAVNNTNCPVPIFVQVHKASDHFYLGVCDGKEVRVEFEMAHLKRTPPYCRYLSGLLDVFKSKVASRLPLDPVIVSVQFTYILRDWTSSTWTQQPPDFDFLQGETFGVTELGKLPFGATFDPVSELHLFATWPKLVETAVVDSESYSDFEPTQAPEWAVTVKMADQPACLLSEYISEFILLCASKKSMHDLLGDMINYDTAGGTDLARPLDLLTEPRVPTFSKVLKRSGNHSRAVNKDGAISDDTLMAILYFLFPDATDNAKKPYADSNENNAGGDCRLSDEQLAGMKTVPVDSLIWRLAVVMSHVMYTLGGVRAAAHLWYEFCEEMVYRWEKCIFIPGVKRDFPDHRTCLLNQKLQMLNCCIERRLNREKMACSSAPAEEFESESDDDDEEFFDCSAEAPTEAGEEMTRRKSRQKRSLWNRPEGRHTRHDNLRLLKTGEPLYIPVTQQPTPKTEDQVKEDVDVMVHLGTDAQAAELRARILSASLLSDMESFKAANPDAILDDFIRWYSPRDWIEEDGVDEFGQRKGCLSPRMQIRGNVWADVWEAAKPVPARRQKRLFDDTREAEKVLHFLKAQSPAQMARLLLPVLIHAAILRLLEERRDDLPLLTSTLKHATKRAQVLTQNADPEQDVRLYEDLAKELLCAEEVIAQATSLEHKFALCEETRQSQELHSFLCNLMQAPQVDVPRGPQGPIGGKIRAMFAEAQKAAQMIPDFDLAENEEETWNSKLSSNFPQPSKRQFVMRVSAARPAPYSAVCPQKLCAVLQKDDFRMAGCFTQDITFQ